MDTAPDSLHEELPPGGTTKFTSIFGAIGNYGMIAGAGMFGVRAINDKMHNRPNILNDKLGMVSVGVTLAGAVIGALHGIKEAHDIQNYREAVANKIDGMNKRISADQQKIDALYNAVHAQAEGQQAAYAR